MKTVDFYFDFMSPFAYLAQHRLPDLAKRHEGKAKFICHPIDLIAARFKAGNTGPFNRDQPAKMKALMMDLKRWANRYGIPMGFPKGLDTARLNRGYFHAVEQGKGPQYMEAGFRAVWAESGNPADEGLICQVASNAGLSAEKLLAATESAEALRSYEKENNDAQARGVFGVPIFMVDDQIYWGNDRIEFLEEYLQGASPSR